MSEYTNTTSSMAPSCAYADLGNYSADYSMDVPPQGKVSSGAYIVPTWSPISYDSLTSKVPSCSGYGSIQSAYGSDASRCQTTYRTSLCGGGSLGSGCGSVGPAGKKACCARMGNCSAGVGHVNGCPPC